MTSHHDVAVVVAELRIGFDVSPAIAERAAAFLETQAKALSEAERERDAWCARESETQEALQAIGDEFGVSGGEPRTHGIRRVLTEMRAFRTEAMKVIEPFALVAEHNIGASETDADTYRPMTYNTVPNIAVGHLRAARAFTDAAKTQESKDA